MLHLLFEYHPYNPYSMSSSLMVFEKNDSSRDSNRYLLIKFLRRYRVIFKKVLHKRKEKMQEKVKMTWQKDENWVQVQQLCSVYFCIKMIFKSWFFWLKWPFECLILMILTMTKYHENSLKDSPLSLLSMVSLFSSLETHII